MEMRLIKLENLVFKTFPKTISVSKIGKKNVKQIMKMTVVKLHF